MAHGVLCSHETPAILNELHSRVYVTQFEDWTQEEMEEWCNFELKFLQNTFPEQFEELEVINKHIRTLIPIST